MIKHSILLYFFILIAVFLASCHSPEINSPKIESVYSSISNTSENDRKKQESSKNDIEFNYPGTYNSYMQAVNIDIVRYPTNSTYCTILTEGGSLSSDIIYLNSDSEKSFSYSLPDFPTTSEHIYIVFYNENNRVTGNANIILDYSEDNDCYYVATIFPPTTP